MTELKPGFYWAKMKRPHRWPSVGGDPTVVRFCDEGGDRWFEIMNVDAAIDLKDADDELTLLGSIDSPLAILAEG